MKTQITNYIRAGYPGLYIVSHEEVRAEAEIKEVAQQLNFKLFVWSITEGFLDASDGRVQAAQNPQELFERIEEAPDNSLLLLRDFHQFLEQEIPLLTRRMKDLLRIGKTKGKTIIILGCRFTLPSELEREFVVIHFALPSKQELAVVLDNIATSAARTKPEGELREILLDSACGLTSTEAENAFALSLVESKAFSPVIVAREKANEVKKNGLLEVYPQIGSLDDIGGLDLLKHWLLQRKDAFGSEAQKYGLPSPKGLLIVGIPGTGKSLTAKATASVFQRPLLKLDAGKLFGGLVGQSEGNLRSVINTVEAIAPCVLWIDEIEKAFSGTKSSGATDGGTSARVFGSFISWLQDRMAPVFVVATANDVSQLPPELLRKGRFDELFFVDLPNQQEREAIWKIQISKRHRAPEKFEVVQLARATENFTGSEIEQAFIDALYDAFARREEPTDLSIAMVLTTAVPLSKLMSEEIADLRKWAKGRARPATARESVSSGRKITATN